MKNNVFRLFMLGTLAASLLIVPAAAEEAAEETAVEETAEEADAEAAEDTASGAEQAWTERPPFTPSPADMTPSVRC